MAEVIEILEPQIAQLEKAFEAADAAEKAASQPLQAFDVRNRRAVLTPEQRNERRKLEHAAQQAAQRKKLAAEQLRAARAALAISTGNTPPPPAAPVATEAPPPPARKPLSGIMAHVASLVGSRQAKRDLAQDRYADQLQNAATMKSKDVEAFFALGESIGLTEAEIQNDLRQALELADARAEYEKLPEPSSWNQARKEAVAAIEAHQESWKKRQEELRAALRAVNVRIDKLATRRAALLKTIREMPEQNPRLR